MKISTFYQKLADQMGYVSQKQARRFYYSLLRYMLSELRANKRIVLPNWGRFEIRSFKGKRMKDLYSPGYIRCEDTKRVQFTSCDKLKKYVKRKT